MTNSSSRRGEVEAPSIYRRRAEAADDSWPDPYNHLGLAPGSYQNDPGHQGAHGGFWDHDDRRYHRPDHRGKGPRGYRRSDERVAEDVNQSLTDDRAVDASDIEVTVSDCEVTLNGTVTSRAAKRRAEDCADAVSGVAHVQNNLRVKAPE